MRSSKAKTTENHRTIVRNAYRLLAENGPHGASVARTMRSIGHTQGGFYRHFQSKAELVALACQEGFTQQIERWRHSAEDNSLDSVANVFCHYVSEQHRDHAGDGCPLSSLTGDAFRGDAALSMALADGLHRYVDFFSALSSAQDCGSASISPLVMIAQMVGAVAISRAVKQDDLALSTRLLREVREEWNKRCQPSDGADDLTAHPPLPS